VAGEAPGLAAEPAVVARGRSRIRGVLELRPAAAPVRHHGAVEAHWPVPERRRFVEAPWPVPERRSFEVSPSQLAFDLAGCPLCLWHRARGEPAPRVPFPTVFGAIDAAMKRAAIGQPASLLVPELEGRVVEGTVVAGAFVRSVALRFATETGEWRLSVRGRTDLGIELPDGRLGVVDLKTTLPSPSLQDRYAAQLEAYAFGFERPAEPPARTVAFLGLSCFSPRSFSFEDGAFTGEVRFLPIARDPEGLERRLRELAELIGAREPPSGLQDCPLCAVRSGAWARAGP
jgi:hypothetical protein